MTNPERIPGRFLPISGELRVGETINSKGMPAGRIYFGATRGGLKGTNPSLLAMLGFAWDMESARATARFIPLPNGGIAGTWDFDLSFHAVQDA
jgi:hypothetical protein